MSSRKRGPDPAADRISSAKGKLAAAKAAEAEALAELAALRLSSTVMNCDSDDSNVPAGVAAGSSRGPDQSASGVGSKQDHTALGAGLVEQAPMDIDEQDHTALGAGLAPRDSRIGLFDGASGESQRPMYKCNFCRRDFTHPSFVAYFWEEAGMPFAKVKDAKEVVNVFDDREVHPGCAFCAEKWHDKEKAYVNEVVKDGKTIFKLTSEWTRLKDKSCGRGMNKHHAILMCELHD